MPLVEVGDGFPFATIGAAIDATANGGTVRANSNATDAYPEAISVTKRIHLIGALPQQGISLTGAGGGAAAAVLSSGAGGLILENFTISNVGSTADYVAEMNVAEDWVRRLYIDGGGTKKCLQAQFGDNVQMFDGTTAVDPSCPGAVFFKQFTAAQMSVAGFVGNGSTAAYRGCLAFDCNSLGFQNFDVIFSWACFSDDDTPATIPASLINLTAGQVDFVNLGAGDIDLLETSEAFITGISPLPVDIRGFRRFRETGLNPRLYGGAMQPYPASPSFLTGVSSIRSL